MACSSHLLSQQCLVLIVFQRRIIYLPSVPPGTRDESLAPPNKALASQLNGLDWKEVTIATKGCTRWTRNAVSLRGLELRSSAASQAKSPQVVVIYLQGELSPQGHVPMLTFTPQATPVHPSFAFLSFAASSPHLFAVRRSPSPSSPSLPAPSGSRLAPHPPRQAFYKTTPQRSSTPSPPTPTRNSSSTATASEEPPLSSSCVHQIFDAESAE